MRRVGTYSVAACVSMVALISAQTVAGQSDPSLTVSQILADNPDPFISIDMKAILDRYGPKGSGIELIGSGIALATGGVSLALTTKGLVSKAESISGATGIASDPSGFGFTIGLSGDYLFAFDKSDLTDEAKAALSDVLALYRKYEGTSIVVEGHTDAKGSDVYNQKLSEQRANSVVTWFVENGIPKEQITSNGYGEKQPVAPNTIDGQDNPEGRALNRRVDIRVVTNKRVNSLPTVSKPVDNN